MSGQASLSQQRCTPQDSKISLVNNEYVISNHIIVLGGWWEYPGCVATTLKPHLIELADGNIIKLVVEAYYAENQDRCNDSATPGDDSANFTLRWTMMN